MSRMFFIKQLLTLAIINCMKKKLILLQKINEKGLAKKTRVVKEKKKRKLLEG